MEYLIVNLDRQFWTGWSWKNDRLFAKVYYQLTPAIEVAAPLTFKSYIVSNYGRAAEKEEYRNFAGCDRSIIWGRHVE